MNWPRKFIIILTGFFFASLSFAHPLLASTAKAKVKTTQKIVSKKECPPKVAAKAIVQRTNTVKHQAKARPQKRHLASLIRTVSPQRAVPPPAPPPTPVRAEGPSLERITARSAMVMDAVTGAAIYAQASDLPAQPASTIKVLTGVISLDALRKNELVEVSHRAAMMPKSKVYLNAGRKYPANDLINAVLLASANDASVALAEKIGGSEEGFARLMTAKARSFGATNTVCKTANGLTASGQHTTAHDLAKIFNNAMRNNEFASKMAVTEVENTDGKIIKSHNRALWQVEGAEGGKTGYTDVARRTYVGKFKRDDDEIVVSLMGSENMWGDLKKLVEYGFAKKRAANMAATPAPKSADTSRFLVQAGNAPRRLPVAKTF